MEPLTYRQFDKLPALYEDMANWPFRKEIEMPSVLQALGTLEGKTVLDFGCGDGTYSRILKQLGCHRVVGYDKAIGMLSHAVRRESQAPLDIHYTEDLGPLAGQFDLVLAVYVPPYAPNKAALDIMFMEMASALKSGGRLITLPIHPNFDPDPTYYARYGFSLYMRVPHQDGGEVTLKLFHAGFDATVTAWYWSFASLDSALTLAGFHDIRHIDPLPSRFTGPRDAPELLRPYLERPHAVILDCRYAA